MIIISDPAVIVIIYGTAAIGYLIDWVSTLGVASVLVEKSKARLEKIAKEKQKLEDRWGKEVTGKIKLDEYGFPLEKSRYGEEEEPATE